MNTTRSLLKYTVSLGLAILLLWLVFKDLNLKELFARLGTADYRWVYLSSVLALASHWLRAYRWTMMLEPVGFKLKTSHAFWALMSGYLANVAIPRMGEVTRCVILKKTDDIALPASFGTVIIERVIDLLILLGIIMAALFLQFGRISSFFTEMIHYKSLNSRSTFVFLMISLLAGAMVLCLLWSQWGKIKKTTLYRKLEHPFRDMMNGLLSIKSVKNKTLFFGITFFIWVLYYFMSYVIIFSFPATSGLSPVAGLVILMAGGLGMSAPVQGGIGTFHAFVSSALILYGITHSDGVLYATLVHTSQFIFVLITGSIGLLVSLVISKNKLKNELPIQNNDP